MSQKAEQFTCECGKQFSNRNDLQKHRQSCATAQASGGAQRGAGGQQVRGAGGSGTPGSGSGTPGSSHE
jgi:hypothetical protein